ncbi:MAG: protein kinase [Acidobacteria bacterium]|nr:protein kinase [Acidobacteriota bacterium]
MPAGFPSSRADVEFAGNERFEVRRRVGEGAFGVVYEAFDRERDTAVALKSLRRQQDGALARFKGEFRALADIAHPNLVSLYELFCDGDHWFFTMEFVEGCDFLEYLTPAAGPAEDESTPTEIRPRVLLADAGTNAPPVVPAPRPATLDTDRLRKALAQLARGLGTLHEADKLHRDIKPANILVSRRGRVVILDFGLVTERHGHSADNASLIGTPAYMSPEQAAGRSLTEASDWYSVGVLLYQALTGVLPHGGKGIRALIDKQTVVPRSPRLINPHAPGDLVELCEELLRIDPEQRPTGVEILRALSLSGRSTGSIPRPKPATSHPLVGRGAELRRMTEAFDDTMRGATSVVFLAGSSGMGKTTLIRHFVEMARTRNDDVVVLESRCYERESVPYKAVDHLIDGLSAWLRTLPQGELAAILPPDIGDLARLFPVIAQLESLAGRTSSIAADPQESRRRAFGSLRHILTRIAVRKVLVVVIDDLQWGDSDSALLLGEVLRPPAAPPLMLLATCRLEEERASEFVATLRRLLLPHDRVSPFFSATRLEIGPLPASEALTLARDLISSEGESRFSPDEAARMAAVIAEGSQGHPISIVEHVRFLLSPAHDPRDDAPLSIETLIRRRAARLPESARLLLDLLAVAARPVTQDVLRTAAALGDEFPRALALLVASHLGRSKGIRSYDDVETYQDQIRDAIASSIDSERQRSLHLMLANAMREAGSHDSEALAEHFRASGDSRTAYAYTLAAADQAMQALAFDRAARLLRSAIELAPTPVVARDLSIRLGQSLAGAGRGAEAAIVFLGACEGARIAESIELQRRAAELLLENGHIDDGIVTLRQVLRRLGMKFAETPLQAVASLLGRRMLVRLRGLRFTKRDPSQLSQLQLTKIDACWSAAVGLGLVDTVRGADFQTQHLLLALNAGEPYRVARALATEAGYCAAYGTARRKRTESLISRSKWVADSIDEPHVEGLVLLIEGMAATLEGRWRDSIAPSRAAETILRERCSGVFWERFMSQLYPLIALMWMGEWREMSAAVPALLNEARQRGDFFAETYIRTRLEWLVALADDDAKRAGQIADDAIGRWSSTGFHLQHFHHMLSRVEIGLYDGDPAGAYEAYRRQLPPLKRSMLTNAQIIDIELGFVGARAKLALRAAGERDAPSARSVMRDVSRIEEHETPWGNALALMLRASASSITDDRDETLSLLQRAEEALRAADMQICAIVTRRRRGELSGNASLVRAADERMAARGAVRPDRIARMLMPGRW